MHKHLRDIINNISGNILEEKELKMLYNSMPIHLLGEFDEFGTSDSLYKEHCKEYFEKNDYKTILVKESKVEEIKLKLKQEIYSKIEKATISWVCDGNKTAGELTRTILKILELNKIL